MARPSLAAMRVFEAAARLGSFKEAAGELAMTPTAVPIATAWAASRPT